MSRIYTDHDPACRAVLDARVADGRLAPADVLCADVREIGPDQLRGRSEVHLFAGMGGGPLALLLATGGLGWPAEYPILTGGFPCQDISSAGRGAGLDGERSGLFWEMIRVADCYRPACILAENVGALSARGLDRVVGAMAACGPGYDVQALRVGAWAAGSPQRRERWWIVGLARGSGAARIVVADVRGAGLRAVGVRQAGTEPDERGEGGGVDDVCGLGCEPGVGVGRDEAGTRGGRREPDRAGESGGVVQPAGEGPQGLRAGAGPAQGPQPGHAGSGGVAPHRWPHPRLEAWSAAEGRWLTVPSPQAPHEPPRLFAGTRTISAAWRCVLMGYPADWLELAPSTVAALCPRHNRPSMLPRWWNRQGVKMTGNAWVPQVAAAVAAGVLDVLRSEGATCSH